MANNSFPFPPTSHINAYLLDSCGERQDLSLAQQEPEIRAWSSQHGLILVPICVLIYKSTTQLEN